MSYTIDTIPMSNYGLFISDRDGLLNVPDGKEQFFTSYFYEGYQATKRTANELELNGWIVADGKADFEVNALALYNKFKEAGNRSIVLDADPIYCFARQGFTIDKIRIWNALAVGRFKARLTVV